MNQNTFHETFDRRDDVAIGSDRNFGLVLAGFLSVIGGLKYWHHTNIRVALFWLSASVLMAAIAFAWPRILHPLNVAWFNLGLLLHRIVSPLIMGLLFFAVVTPVGITMRVWGKRPLNLGFDPKAPSYWIVRDPPGPGSGTFHNQF
jgi:hypothetical protein